MTDDAVTLDLDGVEVTVSHPDKVFFPPSGQTKLDLVRYYQAVAQPLLATIGGRPVLLERYPGGAGGKSFFQKRVPKSAPSWLTTTVVSTPNGTTSDALVAKDLAHIIWAVNLGCIGFHVWPIHAATPEITDELRIDLDPSSGFRSCSKPPV
jgi:DNA primase